MTRNESVHVKHVKSLFIHHVVKLLQNHAGGVLHHVQVSVYSNSEKPSGGADIPSYYLFWVLVVNIIIHPIYFRTLVLIN